MNKIKELDFAECERIAKDIYNNHKNPQEQLKKLVAANKITSQNAEFIVKNFETLCSWANFRGYIQVTCKDSVDEETRNDIESMPSLVIDCHMGVDLISDDYNVILKEIKSLSAEDIINGVEDHIYDYDLNLLDIESVEIIIKRSKFLGDNSYSEDDYESFEFDINKLKKTKEAK